MPAEAGDRQRCCHSAGDRRLYGADGDFDSAGRSFYRGAAVTGKQLRDLFLLM